MTTVTFNYPALLIIVDAEGGDSTLEAGVLYGDWKESFLAGDNIKHPPAFGGSVGGQQLDAVNSLDGYYFLRNDLGWRIRPDERDHELTINGDLYPTDTTRPLFVATVGAFNVQTRLNLSSRSLVSNLTTMESDTALTRKAHTNRQELVNVGTDTNPDYRWRTWSDDGAAVLTALDHFVEDEDGNQIVLTAGAVIRRSKGGEALPPP